MSKGHFQKGGGLQYREHRGDRTEYEDDIITTVVTKENSMWCKGLTGLEV